MSEKLIYPELSYKIIGAAFNVFNELGYGRSEKIYQRAFAQALQTISLETKQEFLVVQKFQGKLIAKYYLDFLIENKIVVELKVRPKLGYAYIKQVMEYLKAGNYQLAVLIYFTPDGVKYRRILNAIP